MSGILGNGSGTNSGILSLGFGTSTSPVTGTIPIGGIISMITTTVPIGYLLCNASTIGNASSGATHVVDDPILFDIIKAGYTNGGSEAYASNNTVKLPDFRGLVLKGNGTNQNTTRTGGYVGNSLGAIQVDGTQEHSHGLNNGSYFFAFTGYGYNGNSHYPSFTAYSHFNGHKPAQFSSANDFPTVGTNGNVDSTYKENRVANHSCHFYIRYK